MTHDGLPSFQKYNISSKEQVDRKEFVPPKQRIVRISFDWQCCLFLANPFSCQLINVAALNPGDDQVFGENENHLCIVGWRQCTGAGGSGRALGGSTVDTSLVSKPQGSAWPLCWSG